MANAIKKLSYKRKPQILNLLLSFCNVLQVLTAHRLFSPPALYFSPSIFPGYYRCRMKIENKKQLESKLRNSLGDFLNYAKEREEKKKQAVKAPLIVSHARATINKPLPSAR